jgi:hypothetical protein
MFRAGTCLAVLLLAGSIHSATAQTAAPASSEPKQSRMKLTAQKLKNMKAKWSANRPKLKSCRQEVKAKGLAGDDRWFYIEDCMAKS